MAAEKVITIDGKEWHLRANALVPRMYRFNFGRDMFADMMALQKKLEKIEKSKLSEDEKQLEQFNMADLTVFENTAWCFIRAAGKENVGDSPDEWLETLDSMFSIYEVLPEILDLWVMSTDTTSIEAKK